MLNYYFWRMNLKDKRNEEHTKHRISNKVRKKATDPTPQQVKKAQKL